MAQLIKLQDYISRYEQDIYKYPSRFVRLKKQQWEKLLNQWKNDDMDYGVEQVATSDQTSKGLLSKLTSLVKKESSGVRVIETVHNEDLFHLEQQKLLASIHNIDELKQHFLDQLLRFQIKWASSTVASVSFPDQNFFHDSNLKYFLQRFPDNVLVLYQPIFLVKKAPFESEIILISPTEIWCITFIEEEENAVFVGSKEHFWIKKGTSQEKKVLNPIMAVDRTEKVMKDFLNQHQVSLPIKKAVICRNGYIDYPTSPFGVELLEKRNYTSWFEKFRKERAPIKSEQLKAAKALLESAQSIYSKRAEWNHDDE